jgi:hypothetical protein
LKCQNDATLAKYVQLEKIKALNFKRAGDKNAAMACIKASKLLEQRAKEVSLGLTHSPYAAPLPQKSPQTQTHMFAADLSGTLTLLSQREAEYKAAALACKRLTLLDQARERLKTLKIIQNAKALLADGGSLPPNFYVPDIPPAPEPVKKEAKPIEVSVVSPVPAKYVPEAAKKAATTTTKAPGTTMPSIMSPTKNSSNIDVSQAPAVLLDHIQSSLDAQVKLCTMLATQHFTAGQKQAAVDYHKKKKAVLADLTTLESLKPAFLAGLAQVSFQYEKFEYEETQSNVDIAVDEVLVEIVKCIGLRSKGVNAGDISAQVLFDFGWPKHGEVTAPQGQGSTPVVKNSSDPGIFY